MCARTKEQVSEHMREIARKAGPARGRHGDQRPFAVIQAENDHFNAVFARLVPPRVERAYYQQVRLPAYSSPIVSI
jgi:hypothetical protein